MVDVKRGRKKKVTVVYLEGRERRNKVLAGMRPVLRLPCLRYRRVVSPAIA